MTVVGPNCYAVLLPVIGSLQDPQYPTLTLSPLATCFPYFYVFSRVSVCSHQQYPDFVDLRLAEADKLFPEGLAGGGQGALERATIRGASTALLQREAADALIHSLDDFAAAASTTGEASPEGSGGAAFGIEGTRSEKWRKNCEARHYGNPAPAAAGDEDGDGEGMDGAEATAAEGDESGDGEDDIVGDVRAAAAEGAAAAAAAAEAVTAAAMAAAGGGADNTASGDEADPEEEGAAEGDKKGKKEILGTGPIWEEMKALAESKRKALKGVRRVYVQSGQVCPTGVPVHPSCCCLIGSGEAHRHQTYSASLLTSVSGYAAAVCRPVLRHR